jgi:hypothetical protein
MTAIDIPLGGFPEIGTKARATSIGEFPGDFNANIIHQPTSLIPSPL